MTYLIIIGAIILFFWLKHLFKLPKIGATAMFTGAPKTGKSTIAIATAFSELRKRRFKTWFYNLIHIKNKKEYPLLYSNIPLKSKYYVPVTKDLIMRKEKFVYNSVIYLGEFSLVADSMEFKDKELNERLQLFCKLIGHETKGGCMITDTQCISDCHYAMKRVTGQYFYIHHTLNIPLLPFLIMYVREQQYSEDGSMITAREDDNEEGLKRVLILKRVWRKFDCYCYSVFTDELPTNNKVEKIESYKAKKIVSFKNWITLDKKYLKENKKNENSLKLDNK